MLTATKGKAVLMLFLAALFGAAAGVLVFSAVGSRHRGGPRGPEAYVRLLDRELHLSPAQRDSVEAILQRSSPAMDSLWQAMRPRMDSLRSLVRSAIRDQLTPAQQEQYTKLTDRLDAARRRRDPSTRKE